MEWGRLLFDPNTKDAVFAAAPQVEVHVVNPSVAQIFVDAIEGAAYVDDPLQYVIDTLSHEQKKLSRQSKVLEKMRSTLQRSTLDAMLDLGKPESGSQREVARAHAAQLTPPWKHTGAASSVVGGPWGPVAPPCG